MLTVVFTGVCCPYVVVVVVVVVVGIVREQLLLGETDSSPSETERVLDRLRLQFLVGI